MGYSAAMRKVALCAFALAPLAAIGCTAILGDFEVTPGAGAGTGDASVDGTTDPDGGGADGATDANDPDSADAQDAQSTVFTTCGFGTVRTVEEIEDPTDTIGFVGQLQIFRTGNRVRVVAQKRQGDGATVYSFDPMQNGNNGPLPAPEVIDLQGAGRYLDTRRLANQQILSLLFMERAVGAPVAHMKVVELSDSLPGSQSIRISKDFNDPTAGGFAGGNLSGALGAYATNNEYFWTLGGMPSTAASGKFELWIGYRPNANAQPDPVVIHTTTEDRDVRVRDMVRSQQTQFILNDRGPDSPGDPGSSFYPVPQTTVAPATIAPRPFAPASGKPFVVLGASGIATGDGIRLAVAEVDFSSTNFGIVRAGTITQSQLGAGFDGTKVPVAFTLTSFTDVPAEGDARFFGDELLWLGTPPDPLRGQGLNFIWYNTQTRVIRSKQTGMQRLLHPAYTNIQQSSIALDTQTAVTAELDVVFTERVATKSILRYARMSCIR